MIGEVFLVETPGGFVIDPEYYCPTELGAKKPLAMLRNGKTYEIGDETCRETRLIIAYFNDESVKVNDIDPTLKYLQKKMTPLDR